MNQDAIDQILNAISKSRADAQRPFKLLLGIGVMDEMQKRDTCTIDYCQRMFGLPCEEAGIDCEPFFIAVIARKGKGKYINCIDLRELIAPDLQVNQLGAIADQQGRYGGGVFGIPDGPTKITLTAPGSGLTLGVSAGHAMIGGPIEIPIGGATIAVPDNTSRVKFATRFTMQWMNTQMADEPTGTYFAPPEIIARINKGDEPMKTYTPEEIKAVLAAHKLFLAGNAEGVRADLTGANLYGAELTGANLYGANLTGANLTGANLTRANLTRANLYGADLTGANLYGANLTEANLYGANLTEANLYGADLTEADLTGADLTGADLTEADLTRANLTEADLTRANLTGANLYGADLTGANLTGADLTRANLTGANLYGANLYGANLTGANLTRANLTRANLYGANLTRANLENLKLPHFSVCPEAGAFMAYKKVNGAILTLLIPEDALRTSSLIGRKCRASKAIVISAETVAGDAITHVDFWTSRHDPAFRYSIGATVEPDNYDGDIRVECSNGIHFFITKREAHEW